MCRKHVGRLEFKKKKKVIYESFVLECMEMHISRFISFFSMFN